MQHVQACIQGACRITVTGERRGTHGMHVSRRHVCRHRDVALSAQQHEFHGCGIVTAVKFQPVAATLEDLASALHVTGRLLDADDILEQKQEVAESVDEAIEEENTTASGERWIDVNLTTQTLVAYEGETPVLYSTISSGLWQFPTITGQFRTWMKYDTQNMTGYHLGYNYSLDNVPHVMYFFEDYAIHGAYWHNNFGTPMSHGCVNLRTDNAEWVYNMANIGTMVNIHY